MKKENENIHLHIIYEDYKAIKNKQKNHFDISEKAIQLSELQKNASVVEQLRKMHGDLVGTHEPETLKTAEDHNQKEQQSTYGKINSLDVSELFMAYQKLKAEEQGLIDRKQDLLAMERGLQNRLTQEICKKKRTIKELKVEIHALRNTCREIKKELDFQPSTN